MKLNNILFRALIVIIAVVITFQACAGVGTLRGDNVRIYYENIDRMVDITRRAIENKGYSLTNLHQRRDANQRTTISFAKRTTAGQQMVSTMQSNVHLAKVDTADAVVVRVDNPDYNYGTPTDQRIDYAKMLFEEIDKLLE